MFSEKIINRQSGILLYGLTPPKATNDPDSLAGIAKKHCERISKLPVDGVVFYDIQDESLRNAGVRPFPFLPTLDPLHYCETYLKTLNVPKVIYQCVGKYTREEFSTRLKRIQTEEYSTVFVGAASKKQHGKLRIDEAYVLYKESGLSLLLGGISIPERHRIKGDEHQRIFSKAENGCTFFITQVMYDIQGCKNMLSDYYYHAIKHDLPVLPVIITLTPCGSQKTLQFMEWLGIHVPGWLKNELLYSGDILLNSIKICHSIASELLEFCIKKNIPVGFNIESVSIRREEIEASIELLHSVHALIDDRT